jgi:hypothetical protein
VARWGIEHNGSRPQGHAPVPHRTARWALEDGCVRAVSTFMVARIMHTGETMLFATGRYDDRIVVADRKTPRFADKVVILDSRQIDTLLAIPL